MFILASDLKIIIIGSVLLFCLIYTSLWLCFKEIVSVSREDKCTLKYLYALLYTVTLQPLQQN